jgi:hypothetical protein
MMTKASHSVKLAFDGCCRVNCRYHTLWWKNHTLCIGGGSCDDYRIGGVIQILQMVLLRSDSWTCCCCDVMSVRTGMNPPIRIHFIDQKVRTRRRR